MAVMTQVAVLFLLIVTGVYARKQGIVSEHMRDELVNLVMKVTLPAFLIVSMNYEFSTETLLESISFLKISIGVYTVVIAASFVIVKLIKADGAKVGIYQHALSLSNVSYMGFPVVAVVYGTKGVFYAAIYNLSFNILIWTYGVYIINRDKSGETSIDMKGQLKKIINPGTVGMVIGYTLFLTGIKLPAPISQTLTLIGNTTTPLSMMLVGLMLSEVHTKELLGGFKDYIVVAFRLLIIPFGVFFVLRFLGFESYTLGIPVLITAMPVAAILPVFASLYDKDFQLASKLVFISTLFSVLTVPLFMFVLS